MRSVQIEKYNEAKIFAKYIIGVRINNAAALLYAQAIEARHLQCEGRDKKLEDFILRHPFWIGCVDAALAFTAKQSVFRKKIFVMLAVLETMPEYSHLFLPKKYSLLFVILIGAVGVRSVYRFVLGCIVLRFFDKT